MADTACLETLSPCGQRILVRRAAKEMQRGIVVPKEVQKRCLVGVIVAKGPSADWVEVGDTVLYATFSGFEPYLEAGLREKYEDCLIMNCEDILCKVVNEK